MKSAIDKLRTAFGNKKAKDHTQAVNYTEGIINSIKDTPFALSDQNVMYAANKELGGYYYLKTIIVGTFKIKTMKGATLSIASNDFKLELKTDMDEFESDHSDVSNMFVTRIDFQVEEGDVSKVDASKIDTLVLKAKKNVIDFKAFRD